MSRNNSVSKILSEKVKKYAGKGWGVGRIFRHLRKMSICERNSNLGLLRFVLSNFKEIGKLPNVEQINYHFRTKVPKNEYSGSKKKEVLADLHNLD